MPERRDWAPEALRVVARLASPLAGDAPMLDSLLEHAVVPYVREAAPRADRSQPAPKPGAIPIPIVRRDIGAWRIPLCSSPVLGPAIEAVEHVVKKIEPGRADLLDPGDRRKVATTNSWTKSYRLPLRVRTVEAIAWFAFARRRPLIKMLRRKARAIGQKTSIGYGRVESWEAEPWPEDWSWFAPTPHGALLMRPLPADAEMPRGLIGARRDFGACCGPYWHPERFAEIVVPC